MNIVITGASAGIGAATAKCFFEAGHKVVLLARRKDKLEVLQKELGEKRALVFPLDVSSREEVETTFAAIEEQIGAIDVLVNNAGMALGLEPAQEGKLDDWQKCIDVNINGLLYCTHSALQGMIKRNQGHIINLGSVAGNYPYPGGAIYCGTKAFIHQFTLCLRSDLLGTGVRVTCVEPGLVGETEFSIVRFRGDEARAKSVYDKTRPLRPQDIAKTILFCASTPKHVNINTLEVMPVQQAFSPLKVVREE